MGVNSKQPVTVTTTANLDAPAFGRKVTTTATSAASASEVIKLNKVSVLKAGDDEDRYEIPTFLRKQAE
jgi:hypothetical protein